MKRQNRLLALLPILVVFGCDDTSPTAPQASAPTTAVHPSAWIWAFDDEASKVGVYGADGALETTFVAKAFGKMHLMQAGTSGEPTLWMGNAGTIQAFTAGFLDHGDHAHKVTPESYATLLLGTKSVHMGQSSSGDTVAFADDDSMSVYLIDVKQRKHVRTITHASAHSAALIAEGFAITTGHKEGWAKIVDIAKDSVLDSLVIGTGSHGDAYYAAGRKAFIACDKGIYGIGLATRTVTDSLAYPVSGRTNFMYHGHGNALAVGLHKPPSPDTASSRFLLLNMATGSIEAVTVASDAALNWHITKGQFSLSADGNTAVFSDLVQKKVYVVALATKSVKVVPVSGTGAAVAVNHRGTKVWALSGTTVERIDVASAKVESSVQVAAGIDWIYVSSVAGEVETD